MYDEINTINPDGEKPEISPWDVLTREKPGRPDFDWQVHTANPIYAGKLSKFLEEKIKTGKTSEDSIVLNGVEIVSVMGAETLREKAYRVSHGGITDEEKDKLIIKTVLNLPWLIPLDGIDDTLKERFLLDRNKYQMYKDWVKQSSLEKESGKSEKVKQIVPPEDVGLYTLSKEALSDSWSNDQYPYEKIGADWYIKQELHNNPDTRISIKRAKKLVEEAKDRGLLVYKKTDTYKGKPIKLYSINTNMKLPDGVSLEQARADYLKKINDNPEDYEQETITGLEWSE